MKMKAASLLFFFAFVARNDAAMSDPKALSEAKRLYGLQAGIAQTRAQGDTYWTKQIGVYSPLCKDSFTVLGQGLNTWEAAFFQVPATIVQGPISGQMTLLHGAYDDVGVASFQFVLDGGLLGPEITFDPVRNAESNIVYVWDTSSVAPGVHLLCGFAKDAAGNIGRGKAVLFNVDPTKPSLGTTIDFRSPARPSLAGG